MPQISTPVAIGSSVPACPTRRVPARRRNLPTTSCDVHPAGLSTTTSPSGGAASEPGAAPEPDADALLGNAVGVGLPRRLRRLPCRRDAGVVGPGRGEQVVEVLGALGQL